MTFAISKRSALYFAPTPITREQLFDRIGLLRQFEADVRASETAELAERLNDRVMPWSGSVTGRRRPR